MEKAEIDKILELHQKWLNDEEGGERADLHGANLSDAILFGANLSGANLSEAILRGANLSGADLSGAILSDAILSGAILSGAILRDAILRGANLYGANLSDAILRGVNLYGANLYGANLYGANLYGAKLTDVTTNARTLGFYPQCPEEGSFIGYKKARLEKIVVLKIPEDAKRSSATNFKCRCDKAEVLRIENLDGSISDLKSINSLNDANFYYCVGETVYPDSFDENRWNECSHGIHFFVSRELARIYDG